MVEFMKKLIIILIFILFGCGSSKNVEFCEGVSTEGKGVKCGAKFSTGDLSILIKSKDPFDVEKITLIIYKKTKYKSELVESRVVDVKPDETRANSRLYFYDDGAFSVEVRGKENQKIAEGSISIIDE